MGFFDVLFGNKNQIPTVTSILPAAAKNEIISGRLPILNTDQLFLKRGEKIHFIDKAVNLEEKDGEAVSPLWAQQSWIV